MQNPIENDTYLTLSESATSEYREKGSKFLAFAYSASTDEQLKKIIQNLKNEYYDAHHHCYAYMLGAKQERYRANDDGEPNHSAGTPILGQIKSRNLTDTLVVVVRYFGGIKLGVSGLVSAYKTAAASALDSAKVDTKIITQTLKIRYNYQETNHLMRIIDQLGASVSEQQFDLFCNLTLTIRQNIYEEARQKLQNWVVKE